MCMHIHKCPNTNVEVRGQLGALVLLCMWVLETDLIRHSGQVPPPTEPSPQSGCFCTFPSLAPTFLLFTFNFSWVANCHLFSNCFFFFCQSSCSALTLPSLLLFFEHRSHYVAWAGFWIYDSPASGPWVLDLQVWTSHWSWFFSFLILFSVGLLYHLLLLLIYTSVFLYNWKLMKHIIFPSAFSFPQSFFILNSLNSI